MVKWALLCCRLREFEYISSFPWFTTAEIGPHFTSGLQLAIFRMSEMAPNRLFPGLGRRARPYPPRRPKLRFGAQSYAYEISGLNHLATKRIVLPSNETNIQGESLVSWVAYVDSASKWKMQPNSLYLCQCQKGF